jgi:RNA polymerase sigma factor (TIGR02999 family)
MERRLDAADMTRLLDAAGAGCPDELDEVWEVAYPRLREMAHARRRGWRGSDTVTMTGLVHEAYVRVVADGPCAYESRGHFFATTARALRQVLVHYAERQATPERGDARLGVDLDASDAVVVDALDELLSLEGALRRLEAIDEQQARTVECLFFAGLSVAETAEALGISPAAVKQDWSTARAWLYRAMADEARSLD